MYSFNRKLNFGNCYCIIIMAVTVAAAPTENSIKFTPCRISNPNFNQCLKDEVQQVIPYLKNGYPALSIPKIEPFEITGIKIAKGHGPVSVDINLDHVKIFGLATLRIESMSLDVMKMKDGKIMLTFSDPIQISGHYRAIGKVQVLPINGNGPCNITIIDPVLELYDIEGTEVERNNVKYLKLKNVSLRIIKLTKMDLQFANLLDGNAQMSEQLNVFINENWQMLYDELQPAILETMVTILKDIVEKVLEKVPKDVAFPA